MFNLFVASSNDKPFSNFIIGFYVHKLAEYEHCLVIMSQALHQAIKVFQKKAFVVCPFS
jgi:hypothetical protein